MKTDREKKRDFENFKNGLKHNILTTRFTNETYIENRRYLEGRDGLECIYCSPNLICKNIRDESILFILEMNNSTNKIMGVGMVRNHAVCDKYKVYEKGNYNRYVYLGLKRIDREELTVEEEEKIDVFEVLCFKGSGHMKRGVGIKSFPLKILHDCSDKLKLNLVEKVANMFKKRLEK